jgi:hypothetical protein
VSYRDLPNGNKILVNSIWFVYVEAAECRLLCVWRFSLKKLLNPSLGRTLTLLSVLALTQLLSACIAVPVRGAAVHGNVVVDIAPAYYQPAPTVYYYHPYHHRPYYRR